MSSERANDGKFSRSGEAARPSVVHHGKVKSVHGRDAGGKLKLGPRVLDEAQARRGVCDGRDK